MELNYWEGRKVGFKNGFITGVLLTLIITLGLVILFKNRKMAQPFFTPKLQMENEKPEEFTQDQQDQMMIADFEARKQSILESDIPAFFGPDPSMF